MASGSVTGRSDAFNQSSSSSGSGSASAFKSSDRFDKLEQIQMLSVSR
jgi:hypothetical protein